VSNEKIQFPTAEEVREKTAAAVETQFQQDLATICQAAVSAICHASNVGEYFATLFHPKGRTPLSNGAINATASGLRAQGFAVVTFYGEARMMEISWEVPSDVGWHNV
jgi:hypothetical protein